VWFSWGPENIGEQLRSINDKLGIIMATLQEAVQNWTDYANDLKTQRDNAVAALEEANTRAQTAADALAQFQADDAATDATQLAEQAQADADFVQSALDSVKEPPAQPDPIPTP
jgi:DNA anti-recombination protein RmuC